MRNFVEEIGFDPNYYTAIHKKFLTFLTIFIDQSLKIQELKLRFVQKNGELAELSSLSPIVQSLAGSRHGDNRFYFPKEMLKQNSIFTNIIQQFSHLIENDHFTPDKK